MNRRFVILLLVFALAAIGANAIQVIALPNQIAPEPSSTFDRATPASSAPAASTPALRAGASVAPLADNPVSPTQPVKLIFIHHSTGENWLADGDGGLGLALRDNHYFVSDTNYDWGPDGIGNNTDIGYWWDWFRGPNSITYTLALYGESGQSSSYSRLVTDPGGENEIIMFKSCFPNSQIGGNPTDPPTTGANPLRGQPSSDDAIHTVGNVKGIYNDILAYFATRQDKLFVLIVSPPLMDAETDAAHAANARAVANWLVNDWLDGYAHNNVAVFDFYNVLTSSGGSTTINDLGSETGNHHRWRSGAVQHIQTVSNNYSSYYGGNGGGSHPTQAGNLKAAAEFVPLLNVFYNRWKGGTTPTQPALTLTQPNGGENWRTGSQQQIRWTTTGTVAQVNLYYSTDDFASRHDVALGLGNNGYYTWTTPLTASTSARMRVESVVSPTTVYDVSDAAFTLSTPGTFDHFIYLPLTLRDYASAPPACAAPLTGVTISGQSSGYTNTLYTFVAAPTPSNATTPIVYTWSPVSGSGQGMAGASFQWDTTGSKTITVTASNCDGAHTASDAHTITIQASPSGSLVQPGDLVYLGAFRLPGDGDPPQTFAYGGNAMTFNPDGHITNTDIYSGSLFITGHDRTDSYPNGSQVAEVTIPVPVNSRNVDDLPYADFIQGFHDVTAGYFTELDTIPKIGMQYLNHPDTGPKIHLTWGRHLQQLEDYLPSQAWFNPDLAHPNLQGEWFIGNQNPNSVNGYLFDIPAAWADAHAQGRYLATGRFSPGGLGGMGPALLAYRPWGTGGTAPVSGTHLSETPLLLYESAMVTSTITRCMTGYQHADEWEGSAWITTPSGKSAVLLAGAKGNGIKYWYGYIHPTQPISPCVDLAVIGDFAPCRLADGSECPTTDLVHCCDEGVDCVSARGWWSTRFDAQIVLYDPADLAQVAAGAMESWTPQPYATLDVDERLYLNPPVEDRFELGWDDQRRNRLGSVTYDRVNGFLYVLELYGDGAKPVMHVWRVQ